MLNSQNKFICLVGMPGAGKSQAADYLVKNHNFLFFRFGQIVLDKVKETGKPSSEKLEKEIRESIRKEYGMAAMAILNKQKIKDLLKKGNVIGDGLRSYEEYLFLKKEFGNNFIAATVFAPPELRYDRLSGRGDNYSKDPNLRFRSFTESESASRDIAELNNLHMGPTLALADYTLINDGSKQKFYDQLEELLKTKLFL